MKKRDHHLLYENSYKDKDHFSFGENWQEYLNKVSPKKIIQAENSMLDLISKSQLKNKSFIDIGCGSGLFSFAAYRFGVAKLLSVDIDKYSIKCVNRLKQQEDNPINWLVKHGSILNQKFVNSLGKFDIVYSWGVLHHTGDMYQAFNNIIKICKKNSYLILAIYNKNRGLSALFSGSSDLWLKIKKTYNSSGWFGKKIIEYLYYIWFVFGYILTLRNPFLYIKNYNNRGMFFTTDIKDWLGGYPYEYASVDELINYFSNKGFFVKKIISSDNLGCHQILFFKK
ncbi:MAG: class I SAM-dependent methyltransferase [Microgenomates group bacterium]